MVSPFAVEKFLLEVDVVGGKGGAMMMVLVGLPTWAESIEIRPESLPSFS